MGIGIGGHQSANMKTDEWLTPPELLQQLGVFDLDPCSPVNRPWDTALKHYTLEDNGLVLPWFGRVWLNPPYGREMAQWLERMADHANGISLIFARTDTQAFHRSVFNKADSLLFIENRLTFYSSCGIKAPHNGGAPSVLIAYGEENVDVLEHCGIKGKHVFLRSVPVIVVGINETWKTIISVAFARIDSEATIQQVYQMVERLAPGKISANIHYKEKIRQILQLHFKRVGKGIYSLN